jgi:AraC-like DNA-binding protein
MSYVECRIAPDVEIWRVSAAGGVTAGSTRILPDGCLDVLAVDGRLLVAGSDTAARVHDGEAHQVLGVRLHAGRGPALLGVPADELRDQTLPLEALWGDRASRELAARVSTVRDLGEWALASSEPDPLGRRLHALLDGGASISRAADELGYSPRQLHRRALPVFGYGLQHLGRVLRLNRAVAAGDSGADWAEVAVEAGYADQAHLTRDFRALAGVTPSGLREERVRSVQADEAAAALTSAA